MKKILRATLLGGLLAGRWMTGCATAPTGPVETENTGQVSFDLQLAPGLALNAVDYTLTGPMGFSRKASIDVTHSQTVSAILGGLPFGADYQIALRGTTTGGTGNCAGSATFDIDRAALTAVAVHMTCQLAPGTGSIIVNGTLNVCPRIDGVDASPAEVAVGSTISLAATAVDVDHVPSPLALSWTSTAGRLAGASTPSAALTCTRPGIVTVTVATSDGDPACASARSGRGRGLLRLGLHPVARLLRRRPAHPAHHRLALHPGWHHPPQLRRPRVDLEVHRAQLVARADHGPQPRQPAQPDHHR